MPVQESPYLQIYGAWNVYHCEKCSSKFAISEETDQNIFVNCPTCKESDAVVVMGSDFIER